MQLRTLLGGAALGAVLTTSAAQAVEVRVQEDVLTRIARAAAAQVAEAWSFHNPRFDASSGRLDFRSTIRYTWRPRPIAVLWDACRPVPNWNVALPGLDLPGVDDPAVPGDFEPIDWNDPFGNDPANGAALELPAWFDSLTFNSGTWSASETTLVDRVQDALPQVDLSDLDLDAIADEAPHRLAVAFDDLVRLDVPAALDDDGRVRIPVTPSLRSTLVWAGYLSTYATATSLGVAPGELIGQVERDIDRLTDADGDLRCEPGPLYALDAPRTVERDMSMRAYVQRVGTTLRLITANTSYLLRDPADADRQLAQVSLRPFRVERLMRLEQDAELNGDRYTIHYDDTRISVTPGEVRVTADMRLERD